MTISLTEADTVIKATQINWPPAVKPVDVPGPFFHGGMPGFKPGDLLLPPEKTGYVRPQEILKQVSKYGMLGMLDKPEYDTSKVYFTRTYILALNHGASLSNIIEITGATQYMPAFGSLYEVIPDEGAPVWLDSKDGICMCCGKAMALQGKGNYWQIKQGIIPCCLATTRLRVVAVEREQVMAVDNASWRLFKRILGGAYEQWATTDSAQWYNRLEV